MNMSTDTHQTHMTDIIHALPPISLGKRLQTTRESLGIELKDVASQLRISEKILALLEKGTYPSDVPELFIRGYLRSYGKLLDIPHQEIMQGIEPIKPKAAMQDFEPIIKHSAPVTSSNYFMQIFTYLIVLTIVVLVGIWWHSHADGQLVTYITELSSIENNRGGDNPTPTNLDLITGNSTLPYTALEATTNLNLQTPINATDITPLAAINKAAPVIPSAAADEPLLKQEPVTRKNLKLSKTYHEKKLNKVLATIVINGDYLIQLCSHFLLFMSIWLLSVCWYNYKLLHSPITAENLFKTITSNAQPQVMAAPTSNAKPPRNSVETIETIMRQSSLLILLMLSGLIGLLYYNYTVFVLPNLIQPQKMITIDKIKMNVNHLPAVNTPTVAPTTPTHGYTTMDSNADDIRKMVNEKAKRKRRHVPVVVPQEEYAPVNNDSSTDTTNTYYNYAN